MLVRGRFFLLSATCLTAVLVTSGCKDSEAQLRAETQEKIETASRELEFASLASSTGDEGLRVDARRRLQAVVHDLSNVNNAAAGQQVAAAMLAAAAHRELAGLSLADAENLAGEARRTRAVLHAQIDAALRLDSAAQGRARMTSDEERAVLAGERAAAQESLRESSARLAELDGPIAERETENERDRAEASRLVDQASALRRQAAESGHAAGLAKFEESIRLMREADQHEYKVAWRETDLTYDLRPEHELAAARVKHLTTMLDEITATETDLDNRDQINASEVGATQSLLGRFQSDIAETLTELRATCSEEMEAHFAEASQQLERAVAKANQAVSRSPRGEADSARLALARSYERQAQAHATRARGLEAHAAVLARLASAGRLLGDPSELGQAREKTETAAGEARDAANAALQSAREELEKVNSSGSRTEIDALRFAIATSLASLTGGPAPVRAPSRNAGASGSGAAASGGYPTAEALLAVIQGSDPSDLASMERGLDAIRTTTPNATRLLEVQRSALGPMAALLSAMQEKFPDAADGPMMGGGAGMGTLGGSEARLTAQSETSATIAVGPADQPATTQLSLINVDGSWWIDGDRMFGMDDAMAEQAIAMGAASAQVLGKLAQRIRDDEFSSPEEAMMAMLAELSAGMPGQ